MGTIALDRDKLADVLHGGESTYILDFKDGLYRARNGQTGKIEFTRDSAYYPAHEVIQYAIDSTPREGGRVTLRNFTFPIASTIKSRQNIILDSEGATIQMLDPCTTAINITSSEEEWALGFPQIRNLRIIGTGSKVAGSKGIEVVDALHFSVENCRILSFETAISAQTKSYTMEHASIRKTSIYDVKYGLSLKRVSGYGTFNHSTIKDVHIDVTEPNGRGIEVYGTLMNPAWQSIFIGLHSDGSRGLYLDAEMDNNVPTSKIAIQSFVPSPTNLYAIEFGPNSTRINYLWLNIQTIGNFNGILLTPHGPAIIYRTPKDIYVMANVWQDFLRVADTQDRLCFQLASEADRDAVVNLGGKEMIIQNETGNAHVYIQKSIGVGQKGVGVVIPAGSTSRVITLPITEPDLAYGILLVPSWNTTYWVTEKAVTSFRANFGTAAPSGATIDWFLFR